MQKVITLEIVMPDAMRKAYWMEVLVTEENAVWLKTEYFKEAA